MNKYIKIHEVNICGIKRPLLLFRGTDLKKYDEIQIISEGEIIEFESKTYGDEASFLISAPLNNTNHLIEIYVIKKGKKYLIYSIKNNVIYRVFNKIRFIINKALQKIKHVFLVINKGISFAWREHHFLIPPTLWKKYFKMLKTKLKYMGAYTFNPFNKEEYNKWIIESEEKTVYEKLNYNPLISIVIPVYNIGKKYLSECIESILNQKYENFEICLADDHSTNNETIETLKEYEQKDERIKVIYRKENGHISNASNSALSIATGEFVAMMDNDDVIPENALYEMVKVLNENKDIDFIYTDEDKLDVDGKRCEPNFKSDYAPDSLLSSNYFCHFTLLRTSILKEIGGWKVGYEGAQDYDLFLRFVEKTNHIYHIPKILYHWRKVEGSTSMTIDNKGYAIERGKKALEDALKRRKINAEVIVHPKVPYYMIDYKLKKQPLISIIIPTRDYAETLEECLKSLYKRTTYKNYEVIVMNNNSEEKETFDLFKRYEKKHKNFKVIDVNTEFNYSNINNIGVKECKGDYVVLLNNDTEIITDNWLEIMVGYASQKHIGTVGAKLLYPDNTVQHAGVLLGVGGVASHAFIGCSRDDVGMYGRLSVPYNYSANTAACLMVSKKKFNEVHGLEEKLKVAYNDVDLNLKILKKGYYNVCLPQVELYHYESKSRGLDTTSEKYKRFLQESSYMFEKWGNLLKNDPYYNKNFSLKQNFVLDKKEK